MCDYQSERHCSKTYRDSSGTKSRCDYQSERHCSKTWSVMLATNLGAITSQNGTAPKTRLLRAIKLRVRLPVRTALLQNHYPAACLAEKCDYQSERHCSKTHQSGRLTQLGAITSQNGTAPKPNHVRNTSSLCAITSQNGTAPKRDVTSALGDRVRLPVRTALLQNLNAAACTTTQCDYQSERHCSKTVAHARPTATRCDYQSERHCSKTYRIIS